MNPNVQEHSGEDLQWNQVRNKMDEAKNMDKKVVIFVYSPNCPHCRNFAPQWENFMQYQAPQAVNTLFYKMDAEGPGNSQGLKELNVDTLPTVLLMNGRSEVRRMDSQYTDGGLGPTWLATASGLDPA